MVRYISTSDAPKPFSRYSQAGVTTYRQVPDRMLAGAEPASTLLVISGLADRNWHVEIQVVAAAA